MRKTVLRIFTIADYEEEELWLRNRHQEGWKLVKMIPPIAYIFESCEPEDVIYRLDFKNSRPTEAYLQMMNDFGWEYTGQCMGWIYFRKPAVAAESDLECELFSDNASRAEQVAKIVKKRLLPLAVIFFCCVIPNFLRAASGEYSGWFGLFFTLFFAVMFVLYTVLIVYCGFKLRRIRQRYEN